MSQATERAPTQWRSLKAFAIVVAIVLSVPGIDALAKHAQSAQEEAAPEPGIDSSIIGRFADPIETLGAIEDSTAPIESDTVGTLTEEIGLIAGARDVRASRDGAILSYIVDGDAQQACGDFTDSMRTLDWTPVALGGIDGTTYVKEEGRCTWALATFTQVGSATSIVVRCSLNES